MAEKREKNIKELRLNTLAGGCATAFGVGLFNPLDTLRIRWQTLNSANVNGAANSTLFGFTKSTIQKEGLVRGLWLPGCAAHMGAVFISSGIRLGFYPTIRDIFAGDNRKNAFHMWLAGFTAGAFGFFVSNPLFQLKVRMQATTGHQNKPYSSSFDCLYKIAKGEGLRGLYRGATTLMARGAMLSAGAQLGYDYTKTELKSLGVLVDGPALHVISSVASAFLATTFCAPFDLIMTKYQSGPVLGIHYNSVFDCSRKIFQTNGLLGFYRGWSPLFMRICPLFAVNIPLYEQVRKLFGLTYLD